MINKKEKKKCKRSCESPVIKGKYMRMMAKFWSLEFLELEFWSLISYLFDLRQVSYSSYVSVFYRQASFH